MHIVAANVTVFVLPLHRQDVSAAHDVVRLLENAGFAVQWRFSEQCPAGSGALVDSAIAIVVCVDPAGDAVQACREIRCHSTDDPILLLTGPGRMAENLECFAAGVDDVVVVPFHPAELVARVRALARRRSIPQPTVPRLQAGLIVIDERVNQAYLGTERLDLTQREFQLLRHLVRNQGQPQSRDVLLAEIWGIRFDPRSNMIDVHIQHVRQKLGNASGQLVTVRGRGYAIRSDVPTWDVPGGTLR